MTAGSSVGRGRQTDSMVIVRSFEADDLPAVLEIVRGLPEYFTEDVPAKVRHDLGAHDGWVIIDAGLAGFSVVDRRSRDAAEILWMAVHPERRGIGLGSRLLGHMIDQLRAEDVSVVAVKTLDRSAGYAPYEGTRAFWRRRGFVQIDAIDPLPGWPPGNPCALYVAALRPTR